MEVVQREVVQREVVQWEIVKTTGHANGKVLSVIVGGIALLIGLRLFGWFRTIMSMCIRWNAIITDPPFVIVTTETILFEHYRGNLLIFAFKLRNLKSVLVDSVNTLRYSSCFIRSNEFLLITLTLCFSPIVLSPSYLSE